MQVRQVVHFEEFGTERTPFSEHLNSDGKRCLQQLCLQILINFVETCHVRCSITYNKVSLLPLKLSEDSLKSLFSRNVTLQD